MKTTTNSVCSVTVFPLLRQSGLDVQRWLTTTSEQWARETFSAMWTWKKSRWCWNRLLRIQVFLGWGWGYRLKSREGRGGKKTYFKATFLQINAHSAFFKKFNFPYHLKISQRYTMQRLSIWLDLYLPLAGCMTLRKPLNFSVPQLEKRWGWSVALRGDTEEKDNITGSEILPEEWGFEPHIGHPSSGTNTRKMSSLCWFENQQDLQPGCRKPRLCPWRAFMCCLLVETRQRKQTETSWGSDCFPTTHQSQPSPRWVPALANLDPEQSPTRLRAAILEWGAHLWSGTEPAWTYHSIQTLRVASLDWTQIQPLGLLF